MIHTEEQKEIFEAFATHKGNLTVQARAGSGKTSTIRDAFDYAPEKNRLYAVFNKKNQLEAQEKINPAVDVKTWHSVGFGFVMENWRGVRANNYAEYGRIKSIAPELPGFVTHQVLSLVGFLKNTFIAPDLQDAKNVQLERDCEVTGKLETWNEKIPQLALDVLELSKVYPKDGQISFDDMVWLPVALNMARPKWDLVVSDECQDLNLPQLEMAVRCSSGRVVMVGDDRQAIYGFRGAVHDALNKFAERLNSKVLSLTISFRCAKKIIERAQELVPDIKAAMDAQEGSVTVRTENELVEKVLPGDAILSRTNAPLVKHCLNFLKAGRTAKIEGKNIARDLKNVVKATGAATLLQFDEGLQAWCDLQITRAKGPAGPSKCERAQDLKTALTAISENCRSIVELENKIDSLFFDDVGNDKRAIVLSTVHKAKGLEWSNVNLLMKTFKGTGGDNLEEQNIKYVAITRAKLNEFMVA